MKNFIFLMPFFALIACNGKSEKFSDTSLNRKLEILQKQNDSLKILLNKREALRNTDDTSIADIKSEKEFKEKAGRHPISLQWIGWDKLGSAVVRPDKDGWFTINGEQRNTEGDYLKINGRIKRQTEKELLFDGKIETLVKYNNDGQPCVKTGLQHFFAKGNRTYFRLQNMENCEGGRLVDYVDIYPGNSGL